MTSASRRSAGSSGAGRVSGEPGIDDPLLFTRRHPRELEGVARDGDLDLAPALCGPATDGVDRRSKSLGGGELNGQPSGDGGDALGSVGRLRVLDGAHVVHVKAEELVPEPVRDYEELVG